MSGFAVVLIMFSPIIVWAVCQTQINTLEARIDNIEREKELAAERGK